MERSAACVCRRDTREARGYGANALVAVFTSSRPAGKLWPLNWSCGQKSISLAALTFVLTFFARPPKQIRAKYTRAISLLGLTWHQQASKRRDETRIKRLFKVAL